MPIIIIGYRSLTCFFRVVNSKFSSSSLQEEKWCNLQVPVDPGTYSVFRVTSFSDAPGGSNAFWASSLPASPPFPFLFPSFFSFFFFFFGGMMLFGYYDDKVQVGGAEWVELSS